MINRSQGAPTIKEQLDDTEQAIREAWSRLGTYNQNEAERKELFEQIAGLEQTADDLRHKLDLSLINDVTRLP